MNVHSIIPLLAGIAFIPLLIILIANRPWYKQHILFASYLVPATLWSVADFLLRSNYLMEYKVLLFRIVICIFILMVVQFYFFIRYYFFRSGGIGVIFGYVLTAVCITGAALDLYPGGLLFEGGKITPSLGWWLPVISTAPFVLMALMVYFLSRKLIISTDPAERNRIIYFLASIGIVTILAFTSLTHIGHQFPFTHLGHLINASILTYVTLRYQILDMKFIARRSAVYICMIVVFLVTYAFWLIIFHRVFNLPMTILSALVVAILTAGTAAIFWVRTRNFLYEKVDELFYGESYDYRQELSNFVIRDIKGVFSLSELSEGLLPPLVKVISCQQAYMLLPESGSGDFTAQFSEPPKQEGNQLTIKRNSPIIKWLKRENRYLTRENLDIMPEFMGLWENERKYIKNTGIELFFPFISRGKLIGILAVTKKQSGKYTLEDANLIEGIANQVAISLEKEYLQTELSNREQELALINRLTGVITSSLNISEVYDTFIEELREVIDVDFATVALVLGSELCFSALSTKVGSAWQVGDNLPLQGTATEWVINHKKSLVEPDLTKDNIFWTGGEYIRRGIRSIVYLPIISKGEGLGSLIVASRNPDAYNQNQIKLLERLASQISTSVANSKLYARAEQRARVDELTGLFNRRHFDETLKQEVSRHSRYGSMLSLAFLDLDNFKKYNDTNGHIAGDKLLTEISSLIKSACRNVDLTFRYGGDEFAVIMPHTPSVRNLINKEMVKNQLGVSTSIGLASWPNDGLKPDDIVDAADRALYHSKMTGGNRTCQVSQMLPSLTGPNEPSAAEKETLNTIYALAATIEARDEYTYGHSRKVRGYAVALAEAIGLPPDKVAIVSHASLLHDIGKIGILDEVLNKVEQLDDHDWNLIKSHPQLSRTIVGHVPSLHSCLLAILHHHERWDGSGYPDGLKGEEIPLEARILTIADSFDAMTSLRPYRDPLSYKEAIEELKRCAGTQFDAKLVEAFLPIALSSSPEEILVRHNPDNPEED
jgi:diguanylate cyclase (GGDEF)-like protein